MMTRRVRLFAVLVYIIGAVSATSISQIIRPALDASGSLETAQPGKPDVSIAQTLFGQLRICLDTYFWLRTDDYLHFGITRHSYTHMKLSQDMANDFRTTIDGSRRAVEAKDSATEERDWRGVLGRLEFFHPIKGFQGDPTELLPWYRMQTALNPLDTAAYVNGAFFLADFAGKPEEALAFLKEGATNNPESIEIQQAIGQLYYDKWKKYDDSIPYSEKAIALGRELHNRNETEEKAFGDAYLFLARAYRDKGDLEDAMRTAEEGLKECPDNPLVRAIYRIVKKDVMLGR